MPTEKYIINLPIDLRARLQEQADERGMKLSVYVRMILLERSKLEAKRK